MYKTHNRLILRDDMQDEGYVTSTDHWTPCDESVTKKKKARFYDATCNCLGLKVHFFGHIWFKYY